MALNRVMVVDDFAAWRQQVCSILEQRQELSVVGEASDGAEAVQKAAELKPDLIVLDIGLPKLSGIEAAARISKLSPQSKILFLSQDNDEGTVEAALETGARGYVHKLTAGAELLSAVAALLQDRRFVSRGINSEESRRERLKLLPGMNSRMCRAESVEDITTHLTLKNSPLVPAEDT
jgi:DNA-binding NarL/FixJ family response regulator